MRSISGIAKERPGMLKSAKRFRWKCFKVGILLAGFLSAFGAAANAQQPISLMIKIDQANIYLEPDYRSRVIDILPYGKILSRFGTGGERIEWYYISYFSEERAAYITGFVPAVSVEVLKSDDGLSDRTLSSQETQAEGASEIEVSSKRVREINPDARRSISISIQSSVFIPVDDVFSGIYGSGVSYGGNADLKVWKYADFSLNFSHYTDSGSLPLTRESTRMTLSALSGGPKLIRRFGIFHPYLKIGPTLIAYKEENPIGTAQGTGIGFFLQAGCVIPITRRLMIDGYVDYSTCKVKPQNIKTDIGGFRLGLGLGTTF